MKIAKCDSYVMQYVCQKLVYSVIMLVLGIPNLEPFCQTRVSGRVREDGDHIQVKPRMKLIIIINNSERCNVILKIGII